MFVVIEKLKKGRIIWIYKVSTKQLTFHPQLKKVYRNKKSKKLETINILHPGYIINCGYITFINLVVVIFKFNKILLKNHLKIKKNHFQLYYECKLSKCFISTQIQRTLYPFKVRYQGLLFD